MRKQIKLENGSNSRLNNYLLLMLKEVPKTIPMEELFEQVKTWTSFNGFKSGMGGSHIWISDKKNNRYAIIYYYAS